MDLTVLGSGTVAPTSERTAPAYWVSAPPVQLLLDCGAGTLHRAVTYQIPWAEVTHLAITHFHPDHWGELVMFMFALRWGTEPSRSAPLTVIGPRGLQARMAHLASAYGDWVLDPEFPLEIVEIGPGEQRELADAVVLEACKTPHTEESLAYGIRAGSTRLVYTGDTGPSEELARWAVGCSLLLAECSLPDELGIELHLTPTQAGALARAAGARHLVLTHFYPVFGDIDPAAVAAREFDGEIVAARDGDRFSVGA
ncbi:MAG: MBL fold metallo-hydrolase [Gemmatimonadales bacterium]|nr:MBL fold metallo-hydrolase [Gemmatimonadales bacterium]NIN12327.1 MBL fold metallo-hydrolase [Gemmatimonadales bacterium]NIN48865.1 MBL fold metallo-hydrolase [Gemmatimonadales bacterium]NIP06329.1 MBL fold metallo-hydrolase [Gemmatimonadales bacterium]NIR00701.1 MBL fold metallo-hydrolase [Gemmatimonadales bacterium]